VHATARSFALLRMTLQSDSAAHDRVVASLPSDLYYPRDGDTLTATFRQRDACPSAAGFRPEISPHSLVRPAHQATPTKLPQRPQHHRPDDQRQAQTQIRRQAQDYVWQSGRCIAPVRGVLCNLRRAHDATQEP
jgi:hypothetical protein